jgi:ABC-type nickel/cobalt efflux system permease component RcnA
MSNTNTTGRRLRTALLCVATTIIGIIATANAHPLGNFTINHFARLEPHADRISVHYVIDMAEIPAFQELQKINRDASPSSDELVLYARQLAPQLAANLLLVMDGQALLLNVVDSQATTLAGAGGLPTLRIECELESSPHTLAVGTTHRLRFEDANFRERLGWREIAVMPDAGIAVFDSTAFGNSVTDALKVYPEDLLAAPLNERNAEFSYTNGATPAGASPLMQRDGQRATPARDRLAALIAVPRLTPAVALVGLLIAIGLGALHAMSPGHGKTVVGAYLVGSRGTARHAAFLGLTVTITHTAGVFALGLVTLFASQYVLPEKLFPILSLISGLIVVAIGGSLFIRRLRFALRNKDHKKSFGHGDDHTPDEVHHHLHEHSHDELRHHHKPSDDRIVIAHAAASDHAHDHQHHAHPSLHSHNDDHHHDGHDHSHTHSHGDLVHSHGGVEHSHLPPGADGSPVTWRSLLALGISGGLLPCPSALVVLLSAISLHRVGYGLLLVIAFSIGLAGSLTAVGLAFVYASKLIKRPMRSSRLTRVLPVVSALVISCAGLAICYEAFISAGWNPAVWIKQWLNAMASNAPDGSHLSTASALVFGLVFGLKHAVEADHLAAVSTIVSERKSLLSSSLVGGLWGVGHTISLLVAGLAVLLLNVRIGERTALALEFAVALMLIALGANALRRLFGGGRLHLHAHRHGSRAHAHPHVHDVVEEAIVDSHHRLRFGFRPLVVGLIHGLAGSAALMLLVLSTVTSRMAGLAFIVVFGVGSIGGMMAMSLLLGLPLQLTASRFARTHKAVQVLAAVFSIGLGVMMAYRIGILDGLFD